MRKPRPFSFTIRERTRGLCFYCWEEPNREWYRYVQEYPGHRKDREREAKNPTREHVLDACKGGKGGSNLVMACKACNERAGGLTVLQKLQVHCAGEPG